MLKVEKTEWDLSPLLKNDDDPTIEEKRKEVKDKTYRFINKWKDNKEYTKEPNILRQALDELEELSQETFGKGEEGIGCTEGYYFWLRTQQDLNSPEIKAKYNKTEEFYKKIGNDTIFFELQIGKIPENLQKEFLENKELEKYHHYLKRIFEKSRHRLSEEEEKIMNLKQAPAHDNWTKMVEDFISKEEREVLTEEGKTEKKSFEAIIGLTRSQKKRSQRQSSRGFQRHPKRKHKCRRSRNELHLIK